ncbi:MULTISPECIES: hypothetical protein [Mesorhizobium]|uniref:hypothetical protein n=1 Tax=Mesorhizobium TaxID=68287 RepID=UPI001485165E|nr:MULTISPECIES: hypothetical protein [Mesorhizobium]
MTMRSTLSAFFGTIGSAAKVASAVENNRAPRSSDLQTLGIDPVEFRMIIGKRAHTYK